MKYISMRCHSNSNDIMDDATKLADKCSTEYAVSTIDKLTSFFCTGPLIGGVTDGDTSGFIKIQSWSNAYKSYYDQTRIRISLDLE